MELVLEVVAQDLQIEAFVASHAAEEYTDADAIVWAENLVSSDAKVPPAKLQFAIVG